MSDFLNFLNTADIDTLTKTPASHASLRAILSRHDLLILWKTA